MAMQNCFKRYEKKYCLTKAQQRVILEGMRPYMKKDTYGQYTICNIYYDTDDWRLIRTSLEKPVYKEKLRVRSYGTPEHDGSVFVEIKKKYDGVVYKRRVTACADEVAAFLSGICPAGRYGQIGQEILWFQRFYRTKPKVFIGYDRLAFAGIDDPELRITFDTNLRWRTTDLDLRRGDYGAPISGYGEVLMEIKIPDTAPLWLSHLLAKAEAYPASYSKYGACYRYDMPGTAREIAVIFLAMAVGLATGMGFVVLAVLTFVLLGGMLMLLTLLHFGQKPEAERTLRITIPENLDYDGLFDNILDNYTRQYELVRVKTANMGTMFELEYRITLPDGNIPKQFLDELRCRNGNLTIQCSRNTAREMTL